MLEGKEIPLSDHVGRMFKKKYLVNGKATGAAFVLRDHEKAISGDWLEFLDPSIDVAISMLINDVWPLKRNLTPKGYVGYFNYGEAKSISPSEFIVKQTKTTDSHVDISLGEVDFAENLAKICELKSIKQ